VSSDEYLTYAQKNRAEWESRGLEIVAGFVEKYRDLDYGKDESDANGVDRPKRDEVVCEVDPAHIAASAPPAPEPDERINVPIQTTVAEPMPVTEPFPMRPSHHGYRGKHFI
jgi:hypothetical protein